MEKAPVKKEIQRETSEQERKLIGFSKLKALRSTIPAITHVDYSARVQTVNKGDNPLYHRMIEKFYEK